MRSSLLIYLLAGGDTIRLFAMDLYAPPQSNSDSAQPRLGRPASPLLGIIALVLYAAPMVGMLVHGVGLVSALAELGGTARPDPEVLANQLSVALLSFLWSLALGLPGVALMFWVNHRGLPGAVWFYRCAFALSLVWLLFFPLGTIVASVFLWLLIKQRPGYREKGAVLV